MRCEKVFFYTCTRQYVSGARQYRQQTARIRTTTYIIKFENGQIDRRKARRRTAGQREIEKARSACVFAGILEKKSIFRRKTMQAFLA